MPEYSSRTSSAIGKSVYKICLVLTIMCSVNVSYCEFEIDYKDKLPSQGTGLY